LIHLSSRAGTIGPGMTTAPKYSGSPYPPTEKKYKLLIVNEQDRQCMYNITMRHVCAAMVAVEDQYILHDLSVYV